jgi:hypothetical protein
MHGRGDFLFGAVAHGTNLDFWARCVFAISKSQIRPLQEKDNSCILSKSANSFNRKSILVNKFDKTTRFGYIKLATMMDTHSETENRGRKRE